MFITIKIKFQIQNLKISTNEKPHLNKEYQIKMVVYTLGFIPILKIKLNSKKIINNQKLQEKIKQQKTKIIETGIAIFFTLSPSSLFFIFFSFFQFCLSSLII